MMDVGTASRKQEQETLLWSATKQAQLRSQTNGKSITGRQCEIIGQFVQPIEQKVYTPSMALLLSALSVDNHKALQLHFVTLMLEVTKSINIFHQNILVFHYKGPQSQSYSIASVALVNLIFRLIFKLPFKKRA